MLAEADLQRISWEIASDTLQILLDLKGAYQYPEANTAVFQLWGVQSVEWSGRSVGARRGWSTLLVGASSFTEEAGRLRFRLASVSGEILTLGADVMEFVEGNVPGGDAAPPDYEDDGDQQIRARLATWTSAFHPIARAVRRTKNS